MEDNYLNRRAAFWDNWRSGLEHFIRQFEAESAGKFIEKDDKNNITVIKNYLQEAFIVAMKRYHTVLGQQIDTLAPQEE